MYIRSIIFLQTCINIFEFYSLQSSFESYFFINENESIVIEENTMDGKQLYNQMTQNRSHEKFYYDENSLIELDLKTNPNNGKLKQIQGYSSNQSFDVFIISEQENEKLKNRIIIDIYNYEIKDRIEQIQNQKSYFIVENKNIKQITIECKMDESQIFFINQEKFFKGILFSYIQVKDFKDWELKFRFVFGNNSYLKKYKEMKIDAFEKKINQDLLSKQEIKDNLLDQVKINNYNEIKQKSKVIEVITIPIKDYLQQLDYQRILLIVKILNFQFLYQININENFTPQLDVVIDKSNLEEMIEYFTNSAPLIYCEKNGEFLLYEILRIHNFIDKNEQQQLMSKDFTDNYGIQVQCLQERKVVILYRYYYYDQFILRSVIHVPEFQILQENKIAISLPIALKNQKFLINETRNFLYFHYFNFKKKMKSINEEYSEQFVIQKVSKNQNEFFPDIQLIEFSLSIDSECQSNYSQDYLVCFSIDKVKIVHFHKSFLVFNKEVLDNHDLQVNFQYDQQIKNVEKKQSLSDICELEQEQFQSQKQIQDEFFDFIKQRNFYEEAKTIDTKIFSQFNLKEKKKIILVKIYDSLVEPMFYINKYDNLQLSFDQIHHLDLMSFVKGNFLDINIQLIEVKNKTSHQNNEDHKLLGSYEQKLELNFNFDDVKNIQLIENIKQYDDNRESLHINPSLTLFFQNQENLIYKKNKTENKYINKKSENFENLLNIEYLLYCEIVDKIITSKGIIYRCEDKNSNNISKEQLYQFNFDKIQSNVFQNKIDQQTQTNEQDYSTVLEQQFNDYFYNYDTQKIFQLTETKNCKQISFIEEYDILFCKLKRLTKLFYLDQQDMKIHQIIFDIHSDFERIYLNQYQVYRGLRNSEFIIFYQTTSQLNNQTILKMVFFSLYYNKVCEMRYEKSFSLTITGQHVQFLYENQYLVIISDNKEILVYYYSKESLQLPIFLKKSVLPFGIIWSQFKPQIFFYQRNEIINMIGEESYYDMFMVFVVEITENKKYIIHYNIQSPQIQEFEKTIPIDQNENQELSVGISYVYFQDQKRFSFQRNGIFIVKKSKQKNNRNMSSQMYQYNILMYYPIKQNIRLDLLHLIYSKKLILNFLINSFNPINQVQQIVKQITLINTIRNKFEIKRRNNTLDLQELDSQKKNIKYYQLDPQYFFKGNILEIKMIFNVRLDSFSNIIQWNFEPQILQLDFPEELLNILQTENNTLEISYLNQQTYFLNSSNKIIFFQKNIIKQAHSNFQFFNFTPNMLDYDKYTSCFHQIPMKWDLVIYNCSNRKNDKILIKCFNQQFQCPFVSLFDSNVVTFIKKKKLYFNNLQKIYIPMSRNILQKIQKLRTNNFDLTKNKLYTKIEKTDILKTIQINFQIELIVRMIKFPKGAYKYSEQMIEVDLVQSKKKMKCFDCKVIMPFFELSVGSITLNIPDDYFFINNEIQIYSLIYNQNIYQKSQIQKSFNKLLEEYKEKQITFKQLSFKIKNDYPFSFTYITQNNNYVQNIKWLKVVIKSYFVNSKINENKRTNQENFFFIKNPIIIDYFNNNQENFQIQTKFCRFYPSNYKAKINQFKEKEKSNKNNKNNQQDDYTMYEYTNHYTLILTIHNNLKMVVQIHDLYKYPPGYIPESDLVVQLLTNLSMNSQLQAKEYQIINDECFYILGQNQLHDSLLSVYNLNYTHLYQLDRRRDDLIVLYDLNENYKFHKDFENILFYPQYQQIFHSQKILHLHSQQQFYYIDELSDILSIVLITNFQYIRVKLHTNFYLKVENKPLESEFLYMVVENEKTSNYVKFKLDNYVQNNKNSIKKSLNRKIWFLITLSTLISIMIPIILKLFNNQFFLQKYKQHNQNQEPYSCKIILIKMPFQFQQSKNETKSIILNSSIQYNSILLFKKIQFVKFQKFDNFLLFQKKVKKKQKFLSISSTHTFHYVSYQILLLKILKC